MFHLRQRVLCLFKLFGVEHITRNKESSSTLTGLERERESESVCV